jgi:hypothetical protein
MSFCQCHLLFSSFFLLPQLTPPRLLPNTKTKSDLKKRSYSRPSQCPFINRIWRHFSVRRRLKGDLATSFDSSKQILLAQTRFGRRKVVTPPFAAETGNARTYAHTHTHEVEEEREEMLTAFTFTLQ